MKKFLLCLLMLVVACSAISCKKTESRLPFDEEGRPYLILDFDEGDEEFFEPRGNCTLEYVEVSTGSALRVSGRSAGHEGVQFRVDEFIGNSISVDATVRSTLRSVRVSLQYDINGNTIYTTITDMDLNGSAFTTRTGFIDIPANATNAYVYLESTSIGDFTVDEIRITVRGEYVAPSLEALETTVSVDVESYESLQELYADYFSFGCAIPGTIPNNANTDYQTLLINQFNSITPENEFKPENVLDYEACISDLDAYNECPAVNFDAVTPILDFASENQIKVRGHVLVWYSQTPDWFFYENYDVNGELASPELMLTRMENYIKSVLTWVDTNYPGVVYAFDVVNEAVDDSNCLRDCYWSQILGEEYIYKAFEFARMYAPEDMLLFYNDYNEYQSGKQDMIIDLLTPVAEAGLIDGMGMQAHIYTGLSTETFVNSMNRYADELGVIIHITELDCSIPTTGDGLQAQGEYFEEFFEALIEAVDNGTPLTNVTVWGLTDDLSWKAQEKPLLFFGDLSRKPAFDGVVDAIA